MEGNPPPEVSIDEETRGTLSVQGTSGSADVTPDATTTFVLTATNKAGEASESLTITVVQPPQVLSFALETEPQDGLVAEGDEYRLVWQVDGDYDSISVDGEPVPEGQDGAVFTASESTTHILAVTWFDGRRSIESEPLKVDVLLKPVILSFTASPGGVVDFGTEVELSWELGGGPPDSMLITEEGGGAVEPGALSHARGAVSNTITHLLQVSNRAGAAEAAATIQVDPASTPHGLVKVHDDRVVLIRPGPVSDFPGEGPEYVPELAGGLAPEAIGWISNEFYKHFNDAFDFLILIGALPEDAPSVYESDEWPWVDNQFIFAERPHIPQSRPEREELSRAFGSAEARLLGVSVHPHITDLRLGPSLRELIRHWGLPVLGAQPRRWEFCDPRRGDLSLEAQMRCSFYARREGFAAFSSNAGQLGGFDIASLVLVEDDFMGLEFVRLYRAGNFSAWGAADNSVPYSELELYSAGMLPAGELHGDFVNMQTATWHVDEAGNPILDVGTGEPLILNIPLDHPAIEVDSFVLRYSAEELVEGYGELPLNPDPVFTGAVVLIVDGEHLPDQAALDQLAEDVGWLGNPAHDDDPLFNFYEATGGRGQLNLGQLSGHMRQVPLHPAGAAAKAPPPPHPHPGISLQVERAAR